MNARLTISNKLLIGFGSVLLVTIVLHSFKPFNDGL